ncbi:hypothetical protein, partial [Algoriphagus aquimarinus]|uniref:hypothetical protein n=1 Tax=Algoriphagus aquimarinus TaxID=237018 RepID=UPI0030DB455E
MTHGKDVGIPDRRKLSDDKIKLDVQADFFRSQGSKFIMCIRMNARTRIIHGFSVTCPELSLHKVNYNETTK